MREKGNEELRHEIEWQKLIRADMELRAQRQKSTQKDRDRVHRYRERQGKKMVRCTDGGEVGKK